MNCREEKIHDEIDNELDGNALFLYLDVSYEVTWQISLYTLFSLCDCLYLRCD